MTLHAELAECRRTRDAWIAECVRLRAELTNEVRAKLAYCKAAQEKIRELKELLGGSS
jgi:hypothetical protein